MVLRESQFLWQQLDGPQANALIKAIFRYLKSFIQGVVDYFDNLNISNASSGHINLFGNMLGIPRPLVWNTDDPYFARWFRFSDDVTTSDQGFSDEDAYPGLGGLLSEEYEEFIATERVPIRLETYRSMLSLVASSDNEIGGLILLDQYLSLFFQSTEYTISWPSTYSPGDILVEIGRYDLTSFTALSAIVKLWMPNTHIILDMVDPPV